MTDAIKAVFVILGLCGLLVFGACGFGDRSVNAQTKFSTGDDGSTTSKQRPLVLVELFTSEGCSSCPPAERLLETLETEQPFDNAEIVTLALHVDYWDRLGWKDSFSSAFFSRRQDFYAQVFRSSQVYTPQMVVDGRSQFVGSDAAKAAKSINENAGNEKVTIGLSFEKGRLQVIISAIPKHDSATVYLAIAESDLVSNVRGGENSGKTFNHKSVVRELKTLGLVTPEQTEFKYDQTITFQNDWKPGNLRLVVFLQENRSRKVFGIGRTKAE